MTVWWGLAGLLGLLGCCGLLRSHRPGRAAFESDPLARYPAAREPATPNADAAHTPLMTPAITPEMLGRPALPRPAEVPESGRLAGEIPAPRPQAGEEGTGVPAGAPVGVSAVAREGAGPVRQGIAGVQASPQPQPQPQPQPAPQPAPAPERNSAAPRAVRPVADAAPDSPAAQEHPAEERAPQQPKHALRAEASAPEAPPEPESPAKQGSSRRRNPVGTIVGKVKRLLRRH